jgi:hypothetical protein
MKEEIDSMAKNVRELANRPVGKNVVANKWVFELKKRIEWKNCTLQ